MLHPSTRKLIDRLAEMTELGKLDWAEGENGSLVYSTEGYSVCLPEGTGEVVLQSIDGKELERAAADALAATSSDEGVPYTQIVAGMGAEAARIARGTETAISSLLAGMEEPPAPEEEAVTDAADESPEDPGDEVAAMASEGIANHEPTPQSAPEDEPDIAAATETPASEDFETEAETEIAVETEIETEEAEDLSASLAMSDDGDEPNTEPDSAPVEDVDVAESAETSAEEIDTESDVTEAVARLADEVNNREDTVTPEVTSAVGAAAATAMGVVATAAGLDQPEDAEVESTADAELDNTAGDEELAGASIETEAPASPYVPFGLDRDDDTPAPVLVTAETDLEDSASEPQEMPTEPEEVEASTEDLTSTFVAEPEQETAPEVSEPAEPEPSVTAEAEDTGDESETEPTPTMMLAEGEPEVEVEHEIEAVSEIPPVVESETTPTPSDADEPDRPEAEAPAPQAEPTFAAEDPTAPADEPSNAETEPDTEPVLAAAEEPKTYSLSGIGAGFGLGALAAKTEASGIPGPSSLGTPEPEKIVIDATEDVLPELEGNLNVEQMEAAVSEISFGKSDNSGADDAAESEDDSEGDILKPRTRFNPWD